MSGPVREERLAIFAEGLFALHSAKTAHGVIRYGARDVVAVIDSTEAGRSAAEVVPFALKDVPIVATPGLTREQAKILRDAYVKTLKDPEFVDEITRRGWTVDPVSGEELQALAKEVTTQPPEVIDWPKKLLSK